MPHSVSGKNLSSSVTNLSQSPHSAPAATASPLTVTGFKTRHGNAATVDPLTGKKNVLSGKAASSIWNICANVVRGVHKTGKVLIRYWCLLVLHLVNTVPSQLARPRPRDVTGKRVGR